MNHHVIRFSHSDNVIAYVINGEWDPRETAFAMLNTETTHEVHSVYMTIAADLVIQQGCIH